MLEGPSEVLRLREALSEVAGPSEADDEGARKGPGLLARGMRPGYMIG